MAKGKLRLPPDLVPTLASDGMEALPISAAQATRNETIHRYDVPVIEA